MNLCHFAMSGSTNDTMPDDPLAIIDRVRGP
jgi:hypothetical protein